MINRILTKIIKSTATVSPIIGLIGPRQSGKTTLVQSIFPKYTYLNLEQPDIRRHAQADPVAFLNQYSTYVIFDEVQRVPELFSYIQVKVDHDKIMGQYILTGSQHFLMLNNISQSLAGRIALFNLYPLSIEELTSSHQSKIDVYTQIWYGGYPRLYDQEISPVIWLNSYIQTYLDRDISLVSQISNLNTFENFLHIIAGRTGQILNLSSISDETGISHNTVKSWINLLETSGIIYILKPFYTNITKRLVKAPKLYFTDTGLVCRLLNIENPKQLISHPLYGSIFETMVVMEYIKAFHNRGLQPNIFYWRDKSGLEADIYKYIEGGKSEIYEIKSSQTIPEDVFGKLKSIQTSISEKSTINLIYGGENSYLRTEGNIVNWKSLAKHIHI